MAHKKYPSIENTYNKKNLNYWFERYPELRNILYVIEEKPDGSNIQIICKANGTVQIGSRRQLLGGIDLDGFMGLGNVLQTDYLDEIEIMKNYAMELKKDVWFYGEFFGPGILKRVDYGPKKLVRLFGLAIGDEDSLIAQKEFHEILAKLNLTHIQIATLGIVTLEEALEFDVENMLTTYNSIEDNFAEGIVIKPYEKTYKMISGSTFLLKKKGSKFEEKMKRKVEKPKKKIDPEIAEYQHMASEYVTTSRLEGIYSKEGRRIERPSEIGEFIKLMLEDIKKDFYIENPEIKLNKADERLVFKNLGKFINPLLRKELEEG